MPPVRPASRCHDAFTLIELLVVIVIIAIIVAIALPLYSGAMVKARQTTTLSNMRQVGLAFMLFAGDNNNQLPGRTTGKDANGNDTDRWPKVLQPYVQNLLVYSSPVPTYEGTQYQTKDPTKLVSNNPNYTTFIANGYNDMGALNDPAIRPRINMIAEPSKVILLGIPFPGKNNFYMDLSEGIGNNNDVLDKTPWPTGSIYVFSDGSSRFLKYRRTDDMRVAPTTSDYYTDWLWLMDKDKAGVIQGPPATNPG